MCSNDLALFQGPMKYVISLVVNNTECNTFDGLEVRDRASLLCCVD